MQGRGRVEEGGDDRGMSVPIGSESIRMCMLYGVPVMEVRYKTADQSISVLASLYELIPT